MVHFDAHLDTWDTYFGAPYTHGTPFRRAREENLFLDDASMHVGIRGPLYSRDDIKNDESFGFKIIHCDEFQTEGTDKIAERIKKRVGDNALYLSIDIDVLDPAGSRTSISIDKYKALSPTLFLILSAILSVPSV